MELNNFILPFILISFGLLFYKYFLFILNKFNLKLLMDDELQKPQAFHKIPVPTVGGLGIFFSFIFYIRIYIYQNKIFIMNFYHSVHYFLF